MRGRKPYKNIFLNPEVRLELKNKKDSIHSPNPTVHKETI